MRGFLLLAILTPLVEAAEPFSLRIEDGTVAGVGTAARVSVLLDAPDPARLVTGFSVVLSHDPRVLRLDSIGLGPAGVGSAGPGGPLFFTSDARPEGGSAEAILSTDGSRAIPPGYRARILDLSYTSLEAGETEIRFGSPASPAGEPSSILTDPQGNPIPHLEIPGRIRVTETTGPRNLNTLYAATPDGCVAHLGLDGTALGASVCFEATHEWAALDLRGTLWLSGLDPAGAPIIVPFPADPAEPADLIRPGPLAPAPSHAICAARNGGIWAILGTDRVVRVRLGQAARPAFHLPGAELRGIAVDRAGNLWVSDRASGGRLRRLTPWPIEVAIASPSWLAADRSGNVWVSRAVGVDDRKILVKVAGDGTVLAEAALPNAVADALPADALEEPGALAVDPQDAVIVTLPGANRILRFGSDGALLGGVALPGGDARPWAVAVDGTGAIWVGDETGRLFRLRPSPDAAGGMGLVIEARFDVGAGRIGRGDFTGLVNALALEPEGNIDGDSFSNEVELDHAGEGMNPLGGDPPPPTPPPEALAAEGAPKQGLLLSWENPVPYDEIRIAREGREEILPGDATEFLDGNEWLPLFEQIYEYTITAYRGGVPSIEQTTREAVGSGELLSQLGWSPAWRWMAADEDHGHVYATDARETGYQIVRFSRDLIPLGELFAEPVPDGAATGLAYDPEGDGGNGALWVLELREGGGGTTGLVREIRLGGGFTGREIEIQDAGGFEGYCSLAPGPQVDPTGDEWFCVAPRTGELKILRIARSSGQVLEILDHPAGGGQPLDTGLAHGPEGLFAIVRDEAGREAIEIRVDDGEPTGRRVPLDVSEDPLLPGLAFRPAAVPWQWDLLASESISGDILLLRGELPPFVRGDCNWDGAMNVADAIFLLYYLLGGIEDPLYVPECLKACKLDRSLPVMTIGDPIYLLNALFAGGPPPPPPYPVCGTEADPEMRTVQICDPERASPACP